jgi:DNA-binding CsgD family transcriptional regulator
LHQLVDATETGPPKVDLRHPKLRDISPRELEVLDLLLQGERVPSIAEQLYISDHTVRNHLKSMFRKTDTGSQAELVRWARSLD